MIIFLLKFVVSESITEPTSDFSAKALGFAAVGVVTLMVVLVGSSILGNVPTISVQEDFDPSTTLSDTKLPQSSEAAISPEVAIPSAYLPYTNERLSMVSEGANVVIFFAASWCPTCKILDDNLTAAEIPTGLVVLKADYDTEIELKQKYNIIYQHTLVHVNEKGDQLSKWSGSFTVEDILAQI